MDYFCFFQMKPSYIYGCGSPISTKIIQNNPSFLVAYMRRRPALPPCRLQNGRDIFIGEIQWNQIV